MAKAPFVRDISVVSPSAGAAADTTTAVAVAPYDGTITAAAFIPSAAITGAATNNRAISIVNKKQDGSGTTTIATLTFASGTDAAAHDAKALTLSGTAANLKVAKGDVLAFASIHAGTGLADPGGLVQVTISRD